MYVNHTRCRSLILLWYTSLIVQIKKKNNLLYIKETNNEFHTVKAVVEYKSPATLGDTVEVFTRIKNIGNSSITFQQEIYLLDSNKLIATGEIIWVNTNQAEMKPTRVPDNLRNLLKEYQD